MNRIRLALIGTIVLGLALLVWWLWPRPPQIRVLITLLPDQVTAADAVRQSHRATLVELIGTSWQIWQLPVNAVASIREDQRIAYAEVVQDAAPPTIPTGSIEATQLPPADRDLVSSSGSFPTVVGTRITPPRPSGLTADLIERGLQVSASLSIELADGTPIVLTRDDLVYRGPRDFTWIGSTPDGAARATLLVTETGILGTVRAGRIDYAITPLSNGSHLIERVDVSRLPPMHAAASTVSLSRAAVAKSELPVCNAKPSGQIKILVLFGSGIAPKAAQSAMNKLVNELNSRLKVRGVPTTFDAKFGILSVPDGKWVRDDRDLLKGSRRSEALTLRRQTESDLVVHLTSGEPDTCGGALRIDATVDTAFATVSASCASKHPSVFHHEIGHLLGLRHQRDRDPTDSPYSIGHGYVAFTPRPECSIMTGEGVCYGEDWSSPTTKGASGVLLFDKDYSHEAEAIRQATPMKSRLWCQPSSPAVRRSGATHVVKRGESLSRIAGLYYGRQEWRRLFNANRSLVTDPDLILPDWELTIPAEPPSAIS